MGHPRFEEWLFERHGLKPAEAAELQAHLEACQACRELAKSWQGVEAELRRSGEIEPPVGFTARFRGRLLLEQARRRTRLSLMVLALMDLFLGAASVLAVAEIAFRLPTILAWTLKMLEELRWVGELLGVAADFLRILVESLAGNIPALLWVAVSALFSGLCFTWLISFYQLSYRNVRRE